MITAVRLKERNKRKNHLMRVYFSAASRSKYTAGENGHPSPFRIVKNQAEISELSQFSQFEILKFDDMAHLQAFIQQEMEERARLGFPAVRAAVMGDSGSDVIMKKVTPLKTAHDRLPPVAIPKRSDASVTNTGRRPVPRMPDLKPEAKSNDNDAAVKVAVDVPDVSVQTHTKAQLINVARDVGANIDPTMTKAEIVEAINAETKSSR
jgi:hypothetical protein